MYTDYMENKGKETKLAVEMMPQTESQQDIQTSPIWEL